MATKETAPLMTSDAARILDVSASGIRLLVRTGKLSAIRTSKGVHLFDEEEVRALKKKRDAREQSRRYRNRNK